MSILSSDRFLSIKRSVRPEAIQDGLQLLTWAVESLAYADGYDAAQGRYMGLRTGAVPGDLRQGLLVKPKAATKQLEAEREAQEASTRAASTGDAGVTVPVSPEPDTVGGGNSQVTTPTNQNGPSFKRFHGATKLDPLRFSRDVDKVAQEVIQHLTGLVGAEVDITLEIHARLQEGAPERVVRTVSENCRTLRFTSAGFEEE